MTAAGADAKFEAEVRGRWESAVEQDVAMLRELLAEAALDTRR